MKRILTKTTYSFLAVLILFTTFIVSPSQVNGETLGDLKKKLNQKIEEY